MGKPISDDVVVAIGVVLVVTLLAVVEYLSFVLLSYLIVLTFSLNYSIWMLGGVIWLSYRVLKAVFKG